MNLILELLRSMPIDPVWWTLLVIGLTVLLISGLRGLLTFLLRRIAPSWIGPIAIPLQLAILAGAGLLIVDVIDPGVVVVWPSLLALTLVGAAIVPGNLISEGVAYARIRLLTYYHVGDWVTLAGDQTGRVTAIYPLGTMLRTETRSRVRISNSHVLSRPIVLHRSQEATQTTPGWRRQAGLSVGQRQGPIPRLSKRPFLGSTSAQTLTRRRGS